MLSFKFLLNSIRYLPFSIGELAKQQTDNRDKLAESENIEWKWAGHRKEGGEMLRKPLLVSDPSLDFFTWFPVSLGTDKWRQCPGKSSQEIMCSVALCNYTCTVSFQPPWTGSVLGWFFPQYWWVVTFLWVIICGTEGKYFSLSFCVSILRKEIKVGLIVLTFSIKMKGSLQEPITWNKTLPKVVKCSGLILRLRNYSKGDISDKMFFNSSS